MEESIRPALDLEQVKPMSREDFQKLLYDYFEDKGILSDLRSHLRSQMVQVLSGTSLGKSLINRRKEISPKLQALNLLIAEHLLHKEYHYSLSVFTTEVPLNNTFQDIYRDNKITTEFKFSDDDMWDILETIGFFKTTENGLKIVSNYKNVPKESLLNCIMKYSNSQKLKEDKKETEIDLEQFITYLMQESINPKVILYIVEQLKIVIATEINRIKQTKNEDIKNVTEKLECESFRKLERYKKKLLHMEQVFEEERKRLETEIDEAKYNLKECAETLRNKYESIAKQEASLEERALNIYKEEVRLMEMEKKLQKEQNELIENTNKYSRTPKTLQESRENKSTQTSDPNNIENVLLKQTIQQLQREIDQLRNQNADQLIRMRELALRSNSFIDNVEDRYPHVEVRNSRLMGFTPALPSGNYITTFGVGISNGGGEVGSTGISAFRPHFRHLNAKDIRRRLQKKQEVVSTSSDDLSPTETILKEAKTRLEMLEKESNLIDEHYNGNFINTCKNDCSTSGSTMSILKEFQLNLASIKDNLSKAFQKKSRDPNQPGTSKQSDNDYTLGYNDMNDKISSICRKINYLTPSITSPNEANSHLDNNINGELKVQNLIAELPEDYFSNIKDSEVEDENKENLSCNSSGIVVATSISTVYISPDEKSDNEIKNNDKSNL